MRQYQEDPKWGTLSLNDSAPRGYLWLSLTWIADLPKGSLPEPGWIYVWGHLYGEKPLWPRARQVSRHLGPCVTNYLRAQWGDYMSGLNSAFSTPILYQERMASAKETMLGDDIAIGTATSIQFPSRVVPGIMLKVQPGCHAPKHISTFFIPI